MRLIFFKPFLNRAEAPGLGSPPTRPRLYRQSLVGLVLFFILLGGGETQAEIFSLQVGIYKDFKNAQSQYASMYNALPETHRDSLRIEKSGSLYAVRIGRFETRAQAQEMLPLIKRVASEVFIRKGDLVTPDLFESKKRPPPGPPPPDQSRTKAGEDQPKRNTPELKEPDLKRKTEGPAPPELRLNLPANAEKASGKGIDQSAPAGPPSSRSASKAKEPPQTSPSGAVLPESRAWLYGSIREFSPLSPDQLGMRPGKEIFRLILRVDETKDITGYPNLLKGKEGDLLTVFSEENPSFFRVGGRIKAVIEYRGTQYSRFFWIAKAEPL